MVSIHSATVERGVVVLDRAVVQRRCAVVSIDSSAVRGVVVTESRTGENQVREIHDRATIGRAVASESRIGNRQVADTIADGSPVDRHCVVAECAVGNIDCRVSAAIVDRTAHRGRISAEV